MDAEHASAVGSIGHVDSARVATALAGPGLVIDLGAMRVRVRSHLADLVGPLRTVYRHYPFEDASDVFVDTEVAVERSPGLHGLFKPSLRFLADGLDPFGALPREMPLPQLEWGINWCFATMMNRHLLLHAGTLDIDGAGVLLMGEPGAGKSTLTAALALRGARALSDEFGVVRLADYALLPLPKPIALKNQSIDVIRRWSTEALLGPTYHKTHKGDVSHLAVPADSVAARDVPARPRVILFPRWREGASTAIDVVGKAEAFSAIAFNSFNFETLGPDAFDAVRWLVEHCECRRLRYSDLDEARVAILGLCR